MAAVDTSSATEHFYVEENLLRLSEIYQFPVAVISALVAGSIFYIVTYFNFL
jgi:hypothetical protein